MIVKTKTYDSLLSGKPYFDYNYGGVYAARYGNIVHIHVGATGLPISTLTHILSLDDDFKGVEGVRIEAVGFGIGLNTFVKIMLDGSKLYYYSDDGHGICCADLIFIKK